MTTPAEFQAYLGGVEGGNLEFKEAKNAYEFDKLAQYVVALANEGGGKIILGVTDSRPRQVVGTRAFGEPGRTEAGLFARLHCHVPVEEYFHNGTRVLIVHAPSRRDGHAVSDDGQYWMRAGDALVPMSEERLQEIHAELELDFSAEVCENGEIADLDSVAIEDFRNRWVRRGNQRVATLSHYQVLADAELVANGKPTYAALLLFGTRAALGKRLPQAEIVFEYRSSESAGPAQDREEYREGFLLFHDRLWQRINQRNDKQSVREGFFSTDILTFDEGSIREAALNAVCHRDYRPQASVFVRQFARRLEVISPGGFPPGVTLQNILDQQRPRNRRLAEALGKCGFIDRSGQGVNLMFEQSVKQSKPLPDFGGTSAHEVRLTLRGVVTNPTFLSFLERVGAETLATFSTRDFLVLDLLQRGEVVPAAMRDRLPALIESGLVETIGKGRGARYLLSRRFLSAIGQKGTYTRRRGLDRSTNKALLLHHLAAVRGDGSQLAELQQVLPALSRGQLKGLLNELKDDGQVSLKGERRWARWFVSPVATQDPG
jgi:ATP-dependent DNA helicase RecG